MAERKKKKRPTTPKKENPKREKATEAKKSTASNAKKPQSKTKAASKKTAPKKTSVIKHSDKDDQNVEKERPIIINPKKQTARGTSKATGNTAKTRQGRVTSITYHIKYD